MNRINMKRINMNHFFRGTWLVVCVSLLTLFTVCKNPANSPEQKQPAENYYQELADLIEQAEGRFDSINWGQSAGDFAVGEYWVPETYKDEFSAAIDAAKATLQDNPNNDTLLKNAIDDLQAALLRTYELEEPGTAVDKDLLQELIDQATEALESVVISTNGFDVTSTQKWVIQVAKIALETALEEAKEVVAEPEPDEDKLRDALRDLTEALGTFKPRPGLSELVAAIGQAREALEQVEESEGGADVYEFQQWVTPPVYATFRAAIEAAESVLANATAAKETVEDATGLLNTAKGDFTEALHFGTLKAYIVAFDSGGGSAVGNEAVLPGEKATEPVGVTRFANIREVYDAIVAADEAGQSISAGGYRVSDTVTLTGWEKSDGSLWDFNDAVTEDMTLTARWSALTSYDTLTYGNAIATGNTPIVYVLTDNVSNGGMSAVTANANVIFLGLGGQQTITCTTAGNSLFYLNGGSVTLGKNIKLTRNPAVGSTTFIHLAGSASFTMLEGSEISGISANIQKGIVMTIEAQGAAFTMEGGQITGNMVGNLRYTWVGIIVLTDGKIVMKGGQITGNNYQADGTTLVPGKRVAGGDIFLDKGATIIPFEISGNAAVDHIFIGNHDGPTVSRPHYFTVGSGWTGEIGNLIFDGEVLWVNQPFVGGAGEHTLTPADIDNVKALVHYPSLDNNYVPTGDLAPIDRRISRGENNEQIGYLLIQE